MQSLNVDNFNDYEQKNDFANEFEKEQTRENWNKDTQELKAAGMPTSFRPIDYYKLNVNLFKGIAFPEIYKGVRFPAPFSSPTFSFQQKSSFAVDLNALGCAWISVNMSQYLDFTKFKDGNTILNGTSTVGNSNVFYSSSAFVDGATPLDTIPLAINYPNMIASPILRMPAAQFNAVRSGPMSVKYEYTGRLDSSSGNVTMGITHYNDTSIPAGSATGTGNENGLQPVAAYSTISRIEDLPHAKTVEITQALKAISVPVDFNALNLKDPLDSKLATFLHKRLFILITGGPVNQKGAARITITANWEGIPSITTQDIYPVSYSNLPACVTGKEVFDYMMRENLLITKVDDDFGTTKFMDAIKNKIS